MILLPTDDVALYLSAEVDEHGWATEPNIPEWTGRGSLQLINGLTGTDAASSGGHGPFDPSAVGLGRVYLPPDAPAADGMTLGCRDTLYALSSVRLIPDPTGLTADAIVADVSAMTDWPTS
jgi:hypothetical protein